MGDSQSFRNACRLATAGRLYEARESFQSLLQTCSSNKHLILNNLGAIEAALGNTRKSREFFRRAEEHGHSQAAVDNQTFVDQFFDKDSGPSRKVAIVSLLFNWPSTGGGTVHTKELAEFLTDAGYHVLHLYAQNSEWSIGSVQGPLPYESQAIAFESSEWNPVQIRSRFRDAVQQFAPDVVIATDSWNTKPLLAEAVAEFPYYMRIAAQECLCPLNNVRLLLDTDGQPKQCDLHQLSHPQSCRDCVSQHQNLSGGLHAAERELAGFYEPDYSERLLGSFRNATGILVVNPQIAELCRPYADNVRVLPSGFDDQRFPEKLASHQRQGDKVRILFAGLTQEYMKGFHVLMQAGELLWQQRQDFEIIATADPAGRMNEFTRTIGWQSQETLPQVIADCDILAFPTIAQEALGRTAVEAMACGRPVVASDIGGLSWVVDNERTGLLCEPGNPNDLAQKLETLLNDPKRRQQMGLAGRKKFEEQFTWTRILEQYGEILGLPVFESELTAS